ncbi:hypothetical protein [Streptomyces sp. NPDC091259]|uniref:hypothetical protein n=1 Tax=Streptomyces sp. NPDC091259 TaxID=3365976 RepID=UPI00382C9E05
MTNETAAARFATGIMTELPSSRTTSTTLLTGSRRAATVDGGHARRHRRYDAQA